MQKALTINLEGKAYASPADVLTAAPHYYYTGAAIEKLHQYEQQTRMAPDEIQWLLEVMEKNLQAGVLELEPHSVSAHADSLIEFSGENSFLSNFYYTLVEYHGRQYLNAEAAFQAMKCENEQDRSKFEHLAPAEAKRLGRKVQLRSDWEKEKEHIMFEIVLEKFSQNPALKLKLLATGNDKLVERNTWHDNYWGACSCQGCANEVKNNVLGEILEVIRSELRPQKRKQLMMDLGDGNCLQVETRESLIPSVRINAKAADGSCQEICSVVADGKDKLSVKLYGKIDPFAK